MNIVISGAGELGGLLAKTLRNNNDVYVIEPKNQQMEHWEKRLDDVKFIHGSGTEIATLKKAQVGSADYFIAVCGNEAENVLSCHLAHALGAKHTICRLFRGKCFSEQDQITAEGMGVDFSFSTPEVAVQKMLDVLNRQELLERIHFANPLACIDVVRISQSCQFLGSSIRTVSEKCGEQLSKVRIAALIRDDKFIVPQGSNITLGANDRIYIAGCKDNVQAFIRELYPQETSDKRMVIVGGGETSQLFVQRAEKLGYDISIIFNPITTDQIDFDLVPQGVQILSGNPTDSSILEEARVESASLFVAASDLASDSVLSSIQAKQLGAQKVITLTRNLDFILPAIDKIDCGFCETIVSANEILRFMEKTALRKDSYLEKAGAVMMEYSVTENSDLKDKMMREMPPGVLIALIFRGNQVIAPNGDTTLRAGDTAILFSSKKMLPKLNSLFQN